MVYALARSAALMPFRVAIHEYDSYRHMPTSVENMLAPLVLAQPRL